MHNRSETHITVSLSWSSSFWSFTDLITSCICCCQYFSSQFVQSTMDGIEGTVWWVRKVETHNRGISSVQRSWTPQLGLSRCKIIMNHSSVYTPVKQSPWRFAHSPFDLVTCIVTFGFSSCCRIDIRHGFECCLCIWCEEVSKSSRNSRPDKDHVSDVMSSGGAELCHVTFTYPLFWERRSTTIYHTAWENEKAWVYLNCVCGMARHRRIWLSNTIELIATL